MPLLIPHQPERPRIDPVTGDILLFATMPNPDMKKKQFKVCEPPSQKAQCRMYRAVRQGFIGRQVVVSDIYDYCMDGIYSEVSKTQMGYNVTATTLYEPRLLVNNKTIGKPALTYTFRNLLDFQYGLEWQICTWLRKFLIATAALEDDIVIDRDYIAEELDILARATPTEYMETYESKFDSFFMDEPEWSVLLVGQKEDLPAMPKKPAAPPPPPPRRFDK